MIDFHTLYIYNLPMAIDVQAPNSSHQSLNACKAVLELSAEGNSKNCLYSYTQMSLLMLMQSFTSDRLLPNEGRLVQYQGRLKLSFYCYRIGSTGSLTCKCPKLGILMQGYAY